LPRHRVLLVILPRGGSRDPEGETLASELRRLGYRFVASMRAGRVFELEVEAASGEEAERLALEVARGARLYNPVVQEARVLRVA